MTRFLPVLVLMCACNVAERPAVQQDLTEAFATVDQVVRAFEREDSMGFWSRFASDATWLGTATNAPDTLSRAQVEQAYARLWKAFDFRLTAPFELLPSPMPAHAGSGVCGYFSWEVTLADSTGEAAALDIHEVFVLNDAGQIQHVQIYSDLASAFRLLREP